jgi:predicted RNase H-like HicB family nuclease
VDGGTDVRRRVGQVVEKRNVTVILLPGAEGGYTVFVPLFPSCTTGGDTVQEALKNAKKCLELALEKPTSDDLEFLKYLDVEHVIVGRIEVEVQAQVAASRSFELGPSQSRG